MLRNRFLRHGYWLMNAEVKFKRKTFNCSERGVADEVLPALMCHWSWVMIMEQLWKIALCV